MYFHVPPTPCIARLQPPCVSGGILEPYLASHWQFRNAPGTLRSLMIQPPAPKTSKRSYIVAARCRMEISIVFKDHSVCRALFPTFPCAHSFRKAGTAGYLSLYDHFVAERRMRLPRSDPCHADAARPLSYFVSFTLTSRASRGRNFSHHKEHSQPVIHDDNRFS